MTISWTWKIDSNTCKMSFEMTRTDFPRWHFVFAVKITNFSLLLLENRKILSIQTIFRSKTFISSQKKCFFDIPNENSRLKTALLTWESEILSPKTFFSSKNRKFCLLKCFFDLKNENSHLKPTLLIEESEILSSKPFFPSKNKKFSLLKCFFDLKNESSLSLIVFSI